MNGSRTNLAGFSLAEMMIAIAILGIGLLMVAASFPVGLDQSRIVADETVAPLVAQEAKSLLSSTVATRLFMDFDGNFLPQGLVVPGSEDMRWKWGGADGFDLDEFYREAFKDLYSNDLVDMLKERYEDEFDDEGEEAIEKRHPVRVYPRGNMSHDAQYTWSVAYQKIAGPIDAVQVVVFVCRGISDFPVKIECNVNEGKNGAPYTISGHYKGDYTLLTEGAYIVHQSTGDVYQLGTRAEEEGTQERPVYYLTRPYRGGLGTLSRPWLAVPLTDDGRSPVVKVYTFYLTL